MNIPALIRLMRLDKPVGILLLWWPTAWALWLADSNPSLKMVILFMLGSLIMRSAGCVMNDIADKNIDGHVARTKTRPLIIGALSLTHAYVLFLGLLLLALIILVQLPRLCFYDALFAVFVTILYPFCKRFFDAPQLILGFAFSAGIPMAFHAQGVSLNTVAVLLMLINIAWTIVYDTFYAMVDRVDDLKIGVRSTAILFAEYDKLITGLLQLMLQLIWLFVAYLEQMSPLFYMVWTLASMLFIYQQYLIRDRERAACFAAFKLNQWYGFVMWLAIVLAH